MVYVIIVLTMPSIGILPFHLQLCTIIIIIMGYALVNLGLECVILLAEVFLPVVLGASSPVAPLKHFLSRHIYVLEELVTPIAAISTGSGDGEGAGAAAIWHGVGQGETYQTADC